MTLAPQAHDGYWSIDTDQGQITIEKRPHYCDRGRFIVKVFPTGELALSFDEADMFPRFYFDWDRMLAEVEAWIQIRGLTPLINDLDRSFPGAAKSVNTNPQSREVG